MNNHNLEKLFQEKFKDFEPEVPHEIWQNIKNELPLEKNKKSYFWYKIFGFVAVFLVGLFILNPFESEIIENKINTNNSKNKIVKEQKNKKILKNNSLIQENNVKVELSKSIENQVVTVDNNFNKDKKTNTTINEKKSIINTKSNSKLIIKNLNQNNIYINKNKAITQNKKQIQIKSNEKQNTLNSIKSNSENSTSNFENSTSKIKSQSGKIDYKDENFNNSDNLISNYNKNDFQSDKAKISDNSLINDFSKDTLNQLSFKKDFDNIESILKSEEVLKLEKTKENQSKWQFSSLVAPIFINNFNSNSSINPVLDDNNKRNYLSLSYGAFLQYQITPKLGIRTGISKVSYIQETYDVNFTAQMDSQNTIFEKNYITFLPSDVFEMQELAFRKTNTGTLKQEINYLEFPLELTYLLIDKKVQFSVLGGGSLLVLSNNNTMLKSSENQFINLGIANNINSTHYSLNFGFGASYPIFSNLRFHFQPTVRYQINSFNQFNNKPYYLGLFSGISFNF